MREIRGLSSTSPLTVGHNFSGLVALALVVLVTACSDSDNRAAQPRAPATVSPTLTIAPLVKFIKLEELTEVSGQAWASVAEFNLIDSTGATVDRKSWTATADSADASDTPTNAIDGNPNTVWHTRWDGNAPPPPHTLVINIGSPVKLSGFRYLPRQDTISNGTIAKFRFFVSEDGVKWGERVAEGDFAAMGARALEKTVLFAPQTVNHPPVVKAPLPQKTPLGRTVSVQLAATDVDADPLSYSCSGLPVGLSVVPGTGLISGTPIVPGTYKVEVSVQDNKGMSGTAAFQWTVEPPVVSADMPPAAPGQVRFVKLEALTEINSHPWASIAELKLIDATGVELPRKGWVASADSAATSDAAANAIDGNPASIWHSQWDGASPPPPHSFIVDLGSPATIGGFRYLPRQDRLSNGIIAKFRFYESRDGTDWGQPVAEGDFSAMGPPDVEKAVLLK